MRRGRRRCRCAGSASPGGCSDAASRTHVGHDTPFGVCLPVPMPGRAALGGPDHRPRGARPGHVLLRPVLPLRHRDACSLRACWSRATRATASPPSSRPTCTASPWPASGWPSWTPRASTSTWPSATGSRCWACARTARSGSIPSTPVRPSPRAGPTTSGAGASAWWWPWPSRPSGVRSRAMSARW